MSRFFVTHKHHVIPAEAGTHGADVQKKLHRGKIPYLVHPHFPQHKDTIMKQARGFTLVEMAIVLVVVGLIICKLGW